MGDPTVKLAVSNLALARAGANPSDVTHAATVELMQRVLDVTKRREAVEVEARAAAYAGDMARATELLEVYRGLTEEITELRKRHEAVIRGASLGSGARN